MSLPRILILDDLTGWSKVDRELMCRNLALVDVTNGQTIDDETKYLAQAIFHPAQVRTGNQISNNINEALRVVGQGWSQPSEQPWALVLLDLQFDEGPIVDGDLDPDENWPERVNREFGLHILQALAEKWPDPDVPGRTEVPVVALSTSPREKLEDKLNNLGNLGYLERERDGAPVPASDLRRQLSDHLFHFGLLEDGPLPTVDREGRVARMVRDERIIGNSLSLLRALRSARKAANAPGYCLLLGSIGAGKELFAKFIHDLSTRANGPYEAINCAGIPDTLIESELFGHEKGAFTDATNRKLGKFESANGGTIFLDEIGYMSPSAQTRLLRVLEGGQIQRLGGTATIKVDVKVIAATNQNLQAAVKEERFKGDLLSRIKHYEIYIPDLKARSSDIRLLFDYFLELETKNIPNAIWPKRIDPTVYELLSRKSWEEGNVRQLRKAVATIASDRRFSQSITPNDILPEGADRVIEETVKEPLEPATSERSLTNLVDIEIALKMAEVPRSRNDLNGKLESLQNAYGALIIRLLEAALTETMDISGDLKPTTAIKLLLSREQMTATQAASYLLSLSKTFPSGSKGYPNVERALSWAMTRRRGIARTRDDNEDKQ